MKPRRRKEPQIFCALPPFILAVCNGNKVKTTQQFFHLFYHRDINKKPPGYPPAEDHPNGKVFNQKIININASFLSPIFSPLTPSVQHGHILFVPICGGRREMHSLPVQCGASTNLCASYAGLHFLPTQVS